MPTISTDDGVSLAYDDEGTGVPVVLIAGFKAPRTSWLFQREALLAAGYRVIALDRRSHGDSSAGPAGSNPMARHGQDLHRFLARSRSTRRRRCSTATAGRTASTATPGRTGHVLRAEHPADRTRAAALARGRDADAAGAGPAGCRPDQASAANIEDPDRFNAIMLEFLPRT